MPYIAKLEEIIDVTVKHWLNMGKKKMFDGVCTLLKDNMLFGILKDFLIVCMDKEQGEKSLLSRNVCPFDVMGETMAEWVMVTQAGWSRHEVLGKWLEVGKQYGLSLSEKKG